jgi:DNA gyrase subunit B/topoisomerase-4 subunit B
MHFRRGPIKLVDSDHHGEGSGAELFIVEGDSAALAVSQVRQSRTQAVLPMQGKPLNALRATAGKVAANPFLMALVDAIGAGWGGMLDLRTMRYERVLLLTDPDADGIHCGALLLMFFHRWMPVLLEQGRLEVVRPPFGEIIRRHGEPPQLVYSEPEFQAVSAELRAGGSTAFTALRYRGLGSLELEALDTLCVRPQTRRSRTLTVADAEVAMQVFSSLKAMPPQRPLL